MRKDIARPTAALLAALLFLVSGAPVLGQATASTDSANGNVRVGDGGGFNIWICLAPEFAIDVERTGTDGDIEGVTIACIRDSRTMREGFQLNLFSDDFEFSDGATSHVIPSRNLTVRTTDAPVRSMSAACDWLPRPADNVGTIYSAGSPDMPMRNDGNEEVTHTWFPASLETHQRIGGADAGMGTGVGCDTHFGDVSIAVGLDLDVPLETTPGIYTSVFTLEVAFGKP